MTLRGRWTLALLTAALIAAAIYVSTARHSDRPAGVGGLLYPALEAALDDVKAIRIDGPGAATAVTLERSERGWQVAERSGYPADSSRVRTLLLGLAQARTLEQKTSLAANYPSLGVEDLAAPGATGTGIELEGPGAPVSLIVGKSPDARSTFVRRKGETASWQIGTALAVERDPAKWLATEVLDIGADRVQSAEVSVAGKGPWSASKTSRADLRFAVKGRPAGGSSTRSRAPTASNRARRIAAQRRRPASDTETDKPAATATYRTFDGLVLTIDGYIEGDKRYVRVRPSLDENAARRYYTAPAARTGKEAAGASAPAPGAPAADTPPAQDPRNWDRADARGSSKLETRLRVGRSRSRGGTTTRSSRNKTIGSEPIFRSLRSGDLLVKIGSEPIFTQALRRT